MTNICDFRHYVGHKSCINSLPLVNVSPSYVLHVQQSVHIQNVFKLTLCQSVW